MLGSARLSCLSPPAVSHDAEHAPGRGRFKGKPSAFGCAGPPRPDGSVPRPLVPRRLRFGIETAIGAGSTSEGPTSCPHSRTYAQRRDIHAEITAKLIAAIEADPGQPVHALAPLVRPAVHAGQCPDRATPITASISSACGSSAEVSGYSAPVWATYRQWSELGAQVRKGEKSSLVVFYKEYDTDPNPDVADDDGKRRVARASYVFNASQVDGFTLPAAPEPLGPIERIEAADRFVGATGVRVEHGGERAYYRPSTDHIQMPDEGLFCGTDTMTRSEGYFAVLLHETDPLDPAQSIVSTATWASALAIAAYAAEELVAEIGSAFLCSELGITQDMRADHAQYLAQLAQAAEGRQPRHLHGRREGVGGGRVSEAPPQCPTRPTECGSAGRRVPQRCPSSRSSFWLSSPMLFRPPNGRENWRIRTSFLFRIRIEDPNAKFDELHNKAYKELLIID